MQIINKFNHDHEIKKILIVEDDSNILSALDKYFNNKGFDVKTANSANKAFEILKSYTPDLLITDWKLNDAIDGADLAVETTKIIDDIVIIFITGHQIEDLQEKTSAIDVHEIIRKPFDFSQINESVENAFK